MSALSIPTLRNAVRTPLSLLRTQRRYARVHDVRFVTTQQPAAKVLEKYKGKLEQKAKQEGVESITELKEVYKDKIAEHRRKASVPPRGAEVGVDSKQSGFQQPPPPPPQPVAQAGPSTKSSTNASGTGIKPLSSYLDLDKVAKLPVKELEYVWRLRHANDKLSLCAIVPIETYQRMFQTAKAHPQFILPLPRPTADDGSGDMKQAPDGFEGGERTAADVHFLQWGFHPPAGAPQPADVKTMNTHTSTVIFTQLAAFKLHGTYAQPHTTVTHHLDLVDSHGVVLLNGSVLEGKGISVEEARWLLMCLQKFYDFEGHGGGIGKEKRQDLLSKFSKGDGGFSLEELVDEAERIS